jgi:hypothetical protein
MTIIDRLIPPAALRWDRDRPFAQDWHVVWNDPRYVPPRIRDLLPAFTASRGAIVFRQHGDFSSHFIADAGTIELRPWARALKRVAGRLRKTRDALIWRAGYEKRKDHDDDYDW